MAILKRHSPYLLDVRRVAGSGEQCFLALGNTGLVGKIGLAGSVSVVASGYSVVYDVAYDGTNVYAVAGNRGNVDKALLVYDTSLILQSTVALWYNGSYGWVVLNSSGALVPDEDGIALIVGGARVASLYLPHRVVAAGIESDKFLLYSADGRACWEISASEHVASTGGSCAQLYTGWYDFVNAEWVILSPETVQCTGDVTGEWAVDGSQASILIATGESCNDVSFCAGSTSEPTEPEVTPSAPTGAVCGWQFSSTYNPSTHLWSTPALDGYATATENFNTWIQTGDCTAAFFYSAYDAENCEDIGDPPTTPSVPSFEPTGCVFAPCEGLADTINYLLTATGLYTTAPGEGESGDCGYFGVRNFVFDSTDGSTVRYTNEGFLVLEVTPYIDTMYNTIALYFLLYDETSYSPPMSCVSEYRLCGETNSLDDFDWGYGAEADPVYGCLPVFIELGYAGS